MLVSCHFLVSFDFKLILYVAKVTKLIAKDLNSLIIGDHRMRPLNQSPRCDKPF